MEYRKMGKTGLDISLLSFGGWASFSIQKEPMLMADELMSIAYEQGVNFFDNSETYSNGESEIIMGKIFKQKAWDRSSYIVSSKVFFGRYGKLNKPNQAGLSRKHIVEACNEALQRLQLDYLDLYYCHRYDKKFPIEEIVRTMNILIQQGKILYWGTSEWEATEIEEANRIAEKYHLIAPSVEQPQYNLFYRQKVEVDYINIYKKNGLGLTTWSPLGSGVLTGKYINNIPKGSRLSLSSYEFLKERWLLDDVLKKVALLIPFAKNMGVSLPSLCIAWCAYNPQVTSVILGASKKEQLKDNLTALDTLKLITPKIMSDLEKIVQSSPIKKNKSKKE